MTELMFIGKYGKSKNARNIIVNTDMSTFNKKLLEDPKIDHLQIEGKDLLITIDLEDGEIKVNNNILVKPGIRYIYTPLIFRRNFISYTQDGSIPKNISFYCVGRENISNNEYKFIKIDETGNWSLETEIEQ